MSERPYDVLVVGELNADILLTGDVTPEFGQVEKLIDDFDILVGSSSGIFAAGAARMGLRVLFSSCVGDDLLGHFLVEALAEAGVDTTHVRIDPAVKTGATVLLSRGQDRAMLTYLGAIAAVGPEDVREEWYAQARHLHVASPFLLARLRPVMRDMMRCAHEAGATTSLDTNWDPAGRWEIDDLLEHLDVFLPNTAEALAISGRETVEEAMEVLGSRTRVLAVKAGAEGAYGAERGAAGVVRMPAQAVQPVDTTGAGDTFDAGFLGGWLRGQPLEECLALGAVAGALTTTQPGGLNGQPTYEEARALARRVKG
ncbi:MAG: carbohydrate kinase family protein [Chloroflexi bacterium]|nr:carbohydrate kinase family protein [Chloroflexota bacterium]